MAVLNVFCKKKALVLQGSNECEGLFSFLLTQCFVFLAKDWKDKSKKMFRCFTCKCDLLVIQTHLQNHAAKHVIAIEDCPISKSSIYVGPLLSTVYKVTKIVWSGDFWKTYNPEDEDHQQLYSPASLRDTFGELVHLVNGIFTPEELSFLTKEVEWLERVARLIKRGKLKKRRRMVTFGIYYKYGKLAW